MSCYGRPNPVGYENMGKAWKQDEINELLNEIKEKKTISEISKNHKRSEGGITSRLKYIAANYFIDESKTIPEIVILTGLSKDSIIDAINKREYSDDRKKKRKESKPAKPLKVVSETLELQEILILLKSIDKRVTEYIKEKSIFGE